MKTMIPAKTPLLVLWLFIPVFVLLIPVTVDLELKGVFYFVVQLFLSLWVSSALATILSLLIWKRIDWRLWKDNMHGQIESFGRLVVMLLVYLFVYLFERLHSTTLEDRWWRILYGVLIQPILVILPFCVIVGLVTYLVVLIYGFFDVSI